MNMTVCSVQSIWLLMNSYGGMLVHALNASFSHLVDFIFDSYDFQSKCDAIFYTNALCYRLDSDFFMQSISAHSNLV